MANLSLDDFAQSKVKHNIFKQSSAPQDIRHELDLSFEKGLIDRPLYETAIGQLEDIIEKASKGEGSKGGHIIAHTRSGKPIYAGKEASHKDHKDWSAEDHADASSAHMDVYQKHREKGRKAEYSGANGAASTHHNLAEHHGTTSNAHKDEYIKKLNDESSPSLSDDEKKIVKEQNKKKSEHHGEMIEHHEKMFKHSVNEQKKHKPGSSQHSALQQEQERHLAESQNHKYHKERLEKE